MYNQCKPLIGVIYFVDNVGVTNDFQRDAAQNKKHNLRLPAVRTSAERYYATRVRHLDVYFLLFPFAYIFDVNKARVDFDDVIS